MSTVLTKTPGLAKPRPPKHDPFQYGWRFVQVMGPDGEPAPKQVPLTLEDVLHPQEDDFIVNSPLHDWIQNYLKLALEARFAERPDVVVLGDTRIEWGKPKGLAHGPDVVVFDRVRRGWSNRQGTFHLKRTGGRIVLVIEVTSPKTRGNDFGYKLREYFEVGVPLYVIVDPPEENKKGGINLYGYRAGKKQFEPLTTSDGPRLWLEPIQLWLGVKGMEVYLEDEQGNRLPDYATLTKVAKAAQERIKTLENEIARLKGK